ncbi:MAG: metal-sulfur cluster assembly factor [Gemmatimonadales bacterium]|jgi:metal-sulfur cluster biosynthetic enzyme
MDNEMTDDLRQRELPEIQGKILESLKGVIDPELGLNIVDLGLVYDIDVDEDKATVTMTLTSPGCPAGGMIMSGAQEAASSVEGVDAAVVNLVWKPFWTPERIDPDVRAALGF